MVTITTTALPDRGKRIRETDHGAVLNEQCRKTLKQWNGAGAGGDELLERSLKDLLEAGDCGIGEAVSKALDRDGAAQCGERVDKILGSGGR